MIRSGVVDFMAFINAGAEIALLPMYVHEHRSRNRLSSNDVWKGLFSQYEIAFLVQLWNWKRSICLNRFYVDYSKAYGTFKYQGR
jgi:hypothetical protein